MTIRRDHSESGADLAAPFVSSPQGEQHPILNGLLINILLTLYLTLPAYN